jgi:PEGA domain-containing protein
MTHLCVRTQQTRRLAVSRRVIVAALAALAILPTGCVRRRLFVQSNPPGAMLFVDNQQIGTTPCSVDFSYYGTREIRLVKPGFETLTVNQPIPTPWYEVPPIDFVSENIVPSRVAFNMQPQVIVPTDQLLDRANQLRQETLQGTVVPAATTGVPGAAPAATLIPGTFSPPGAIGAVPIGSPYPIPLPPTGLSTGPALAPAAAPPIVASPTPAAPQLGPPIVSPPLR